MFNHDAALGQLAKYGLGLRPLGRAGIQLDRPREVGLGTFDVALFRDTSPSWYTGSTQLGSAVAALSNHPAASSVSPRANAAVPRL